MATYNSNGRWLRGLAAAAVLCAPLAGCGGQSMADLHAYVDEVLARKGSGVEPLPPVQLPEVYVYQCVDQGCVDPFEPFFKEEPPPPEEQGQQASGSGIRPNFDRNREELETYTLDSLRMVGTLEQGDATWGIVRSPDAIIHRVKVGNYVGKNHGKIVAIMEEKIDIQEIVPDNQGGWMERDASLALIE